MAILIYVIGVLVMVWASGYADTRDQEAPFVVGMIILQIMLLDKVISEFLVLDWKKPSRSAWRLRGGNDHHNPNLASPFFRFHGWLLSGLCDCREEA